MYLINVSQEKKKKQKKKQLPLPVVFILLLLPIPNFQSLAGDDKLQVDHMSESMFICIQQLKPQ